MATGKKTQASQSRKNEITEEIPSHPPEVPEPSADGDGPMPKADLPDDVPADVGKSDAPTPAPTPAPTNDKETLADKVDKEKLLTFVESLVDTLTFKRVGLIALLSVIGIALWSLYENRIDIVDSLVHDGKTTTIAPAPASWQLSEESKASLVNLAKTTSVNFIAVTDVDLQKNRRTVRYYFTDVKMSTDALRAIGLPQAVFDYDAKNTRQIVAMLSNEFRCDPYHETIYFRYAPELETTVPMICRMAIPPFVGSFVGFITVGMSSQISSTERDTIRLEISRMAVDIYLKDVIKKSSSLASP